MKRIETHFTALGGATHMSAQNVVYLGGERELYTWRDVAQFTFIHHYARGIKAETNDCARMKLPVLLK